MQMVTRILVALLMVFAVATGHGSINGIQQMKIDFTNAADANSQATWSDPQKITVSKDGLGWDGEAASMWEGSFHTKPLPLGLSWRPAYSISVRVQILPPAREITLNSGQRSIPPDGELYIRYSPDLEHWSSWQVLQHANPQSPDAKQPARIYRGTIAVPKLERKEYDSLLSEYSRLDVPWKSDEEAAVHWILGRDPDFFSRHIPFIGYVEFAYEGEFFGGQRIQSFEADVSYGMSGLHSPPKDKAVYKNRDSTPWRFKAKKDPTAEQSAAADAIKPRR
jgi:hypothetical protein